jgi:hypothetical protein
MKGHINIGDIGIEAALALDRHIVPAVFTELP